MSGGRGGGVALGPQWRPCPCPATPQESCASAEVRATPRGSGGRAGVDPTCLQVIPPSPSHVPSEGCRMCGGGVVLRGPGSIPSSVSCLLKLRGTCQVLQWLGIHLSTQGREVRSLVWEDPACRRATKSALQLLSPQSRTRALPREKLPREVPRALQMLSPRAGACAPQREACAATKTQCSQDRLERRRKVHDAPPALAATSLHRGCVSHAFAFGFFFFF